MTYTMIVMEININIPLLINGLDNVLLDPPLIAYKVHLFPKKNDENRQSQYKNTIQSRQSGQCHLFLFNVFIPLLLRLPS